MRTALLTDPAISCLCWESTTSLQRGVLSQNCQMATPPFMWKREMIFTEKTAYTMIRSVFRYHQAASRHFMSQFCPFDYHRAHDVEVSLAKCCNKERAHLHDDRPAAWYFGIHALSGLKNHFAVNHQWEKKGKVKCRMNISGPRCLIALN